MAFCENCGAGINPADKFCENCGASVGTNTGNTVPPPPVQQVTAPGPMSGQGPKSPALAAIASFLFSGLGQVYNGNLGKGLLIFFGTIIGYMIFVIPGLIVLVYGIYDAYTTAKKMNEGQIPFVPYQTMHIIAFIAIGIIVGIIFFMVLASMALALGGL
jgi:TM2 domain-containing membrane protein YozV